MVTRGLPQRGQGDPDMMILVAGLLIFLGIHSVAIVAPGWRNARERSLGTGTWKGLYSVVAAVGLVLIVVGYMAARSYPVVLWNPPTALRHVAWLLMLPVFVLLIATYLPGRISRAARHPMLLAVKLWALAHLLANGGVADLLLFGSFLAWAVADRISVKRRGERLARRLSCRRAAPTMRSRSWAACVLYAAFFLFLHRWLIGVAPR